MAVLSLLGASVAAHAAGDDNASLAAPYALDASHQTIASVLGRFATDHGLTLHAGGDPAAGWQTATLDGWVRAPSGRAFLEQLSQAHHFSWFIAERSLYVSAVRDFAVERIELDGMRADGARAALEAVGLYDARFGWGELPGKDAILVGGPRAYRALVRRFLVSRPNTMSASIDPAPMVFPLRFAQAADHLPSNAHGAARPGVAALLRQLLSSDMPAGQPAFAIAEQSNAPPLPPPAAPIARGIGFPSVSSALSSDLSPSRRLSAARGTETGLANAGIVADEGTNSVIVWADRRWRGHLQQLVDALDRPAAIVSMEVLVVEGDAAAVSALSAAAERTHAVTAARPPAFDDPVADALGASRVRLINRQTLVGQMNAHLTLAIGGEASQVSAAPTEAPHQAAGETLNGRGGNQGDRLDLAARVLPSDGTDAIRLSVDVDLLMTQPTGLPGQPWANTSSVKLDTAITLESGAPPRLIASYPVATARGEQRAIFISAKAL